MDPKNHSQTMIRPIFLFLLILLTTSGIYSENKQQTITVIGNGSAIVETDYVQINFSVEVENPDPKVAQEKNLERVSNVIQALSKRFKISNKDIYSTRLHSPKTIFTRRKTKTLSCVFWNSTETQRSQTL